MVYPGDFVIPRRMMDADDEVHEFNDDVMVEAWYGDPMLISRFEDPEKAPIAAPPASASSRHSWPSATRTEWPPKPIST